MRYKCSLGKPQSWARPIFSNQLQDNWKFTDNLGKLFPHEVQEYYFPMKHFQINQKYINKDFWYVMWIVKGKLHSTPIQRANKFKLKKT